MTGDFYKNFTKRKNSTKQPGSTDSHDSKTFTLKEGCSVEHPTFVLQSSELSYNYVSTFGHYYFVDDIKIVRNDLIEVSCSMDVLATFKSAIGNYTAFVERASADYDQWVPDPMCAVLPYQAVDKNTAASGLSSSGCFALSVLNTKGSGVGFTTTYLMNVTNIEYVAQYCNTNWGAAVGPLDIVEWLQATFLKTANSIIDCVWLPVSYSDVSSLPNVSYEAVEIGVDTLSAYGYRLTGPCVKHFSGASITLPTPTHANDFRRYAPYTTYKIYIPGYGMMDINQAEFSTGLFADLDVDMSTGDAICYLTSGTNRIATVHYNLGVSCPVGKVSSDVTGTMVGIIQTRANMVSAAVPGNRYAEVSQLEAVASGINTLATAAAVTPSVSGSKGGRAFTYGGLDYMVVMFEHTSLDPSDYWATSGLMLMQDKTINTIAGYIKCINASVPIAGMNGEKEEVNSFLNSGFYYE